jgi:hypothetical protein
LVQLKIFTVSLAVIFCFYAMFVFSINLFMYDFPGPSFEILGQNNEGIFSSLSRNFEQTIEEINSADEKNTATTTQSDSSNTDDEDSSTVDVPDITDESSSLDSNNSTTTEDFRNKNQSSLNN